MPDRGKPHCALRITHCALPGRGKAGESALPARQCVMWNAQWAMVFPTVRLPPRCLVALFTQRPWKKLDSKNCSKCGRTVSNMENASPFYFLIRRSLPIGGIGWFYDVTLASLGRKNDHACFWLFGL